jgi:hypothetical protein
VNDEAEGADLMKVAQSEGMLGLLAAAAKNADAIITGALGTEKLHLFMIPGRLVQGARNKSFIGQLAREFDELRAKGAIKPDYGRSEQAQACLQELLAALEDPPVDNVKFNLLKSLFLAACAEARTSRSDLSPQLLMNIARRLNSGEIVLMAATYRVAQTPEGALERVGSAAGVWIQEMSRRSGLGTGSMVEVYEEGLMQKKILTPRRYGDRSGIDAGPNFRLTDLGVELCKVLSAKPPDDKAAS